MYNLAFDTTGQSCSVILTQDGITLEKSVKKNGFRTGGSIASDNSEYFG